MGGEHSIDALAGHPDDWSAGEAALDGAGIGVSLDGQTPDGGGVNNA